jgi:transposase-like protein
MAHSEEIKKMAEERFRKGATIYRISKDLDIPRTTVQEWKKEWKRGIVERFIFRK